MTGEKVIIECGAIETRAALIRDGRVVRFWFGPASGGEPADNRPIEGRLFAGRIRRIDKELNAAFVDIGAAEDAFLRLKTASAHSEGAGIIVRILARPRRTKGAVVDFVRTDNEGAAPGRIEHKPAAIEVVDALAGDGADIITDSADVLSILRDHGKDVRRTSGDETKGLFAAYGTDDVLDDALSATVSLPGGGALHFAETEALVAIDVDTGSASAASSERLREKTIAEATAEASRQIERRNLSGRIVIDFPSIRTRSVRTRAVQQIESTLAGIPRVTSTKIAGSNFTTLIRERLGASLWDETTEATTDAPAPGRRFTLDWLARCAIREVEWRQAAAPGLRLCLHAGNALHASLRETAKLTDAYFSRWGVRLEIACDDRIGDRDFEIVER